MVQEKHASLEMLTNVISEFLNADVLHLNYHYVKSLVHYENVRNKMQEQTVAGNMQLWNEKNLSHISLQMDPTDSNTSVRHNHI